MSNESREDSRNEPTVVVHQAGTATEAMIIRGLLENAGITSPPSTTTDPFPLNQPPAGTHGVEIMVLESQAEEAWRVISEYLQSGQGIESDEDAETGGEG